MTDDKPRIEVTQREKVIEVALLDTEILDESTINDISDSLFAVVEEHLPVKMLLNFSQVQHLSSSALGTLVRLNKRIQDTQGEFKLCRIHPSLREIFVITKLNKILDIHDEAATALRSFSD